MVWKSNSRGIDELETIEDEYGKRGGYTNCTKMSSISIPSYVYIIGNKVSLKVRYWHQRKTWIMRYMNNNI